MARLDYNTCIALDITDPTPYEDWAEEPETEPHEILDGRPCPVCGRPIMSDEYATCASLENDTYNKYQKLFHSGCLTDGNIELLERIGYSLYEDKAENFDD